MSHQTPADAIPVEMEAKLLVPAAADLRAIARLTELGPYRLQPRGAARLHTTYLDTPSLTLARYGVAVRLRRQGRRWEATMKWGGRVEGDVHERPELTVALASAPVLPFVPPPGPLHTQLAALLAGRPLTPILISEIHRRVFDVLPSDPALATEPLAELALDRVHLRAPQDGQPETAYCEVEIERRHGERRDVAGLARWLRQRFDLAPSIDSKFSRGLMLLYGRGIIGDAERHVRAHDTVRDATRHVVAFHLHRLRLHDPAVRIGADPEALHDMRVATRRLRAAVRALAGGMPAQLLDGLSRELEWLGRLLGSVRDVDVQLAKLRHFSAAAPAGFRPSLGCLRDYMDGERMRHRAALLAALDHPRYFRLLLRLERFAAARTQGRRGDAATQESIVVAGQRAIKKAFRRLLKRGAKIHATPHPEDLHALRIRAKRLRYLLEFLQELTGKPGRRLVKRLTKLQDLLGSYHDAVVLADVVRVYVEGAGARLAPVQMVALGALVASELRLAEQRRADFDGTWRRFARPRTAAVCDALLEKLGRLHGPLATETPPVPAAPAAAPAGPVNAAALAAGPSPKTEES